MKTNRPARHHKSSYSKAVANHKALRAILPKVLDERVFLRDTEPIAPSLRREMPADAGRPGSNRDRAVCALVNKGANTHASILALTDAGHGDDAMALARVLMENAGLLRWLLLDPIYRLDLFCISDALFVRRWAQLVVEHYQHKPELVEQAKAALTREVMGVADFFGDTVHRWAQVLHPTGKHHKVNFEAMLTELADAHGSESTFSRDAVYFLHSSFVHSTASSMRSFRRLRAETFFNFELGPNSARCEEALRGSNLFFWQILVAALTYMQCDQLAADVHALFDTFKSRSK